MESRIDLWRRLCLVAAMADKDWNAAYLQADTPWDKGAAAPPLREFLQRHRLAGHALVPGCGRGHDLRLLVDAGLSGVGLDFAPAAIEAANALRAGPRESYQQGDFLRLPAEHCGRYDWVVEHTCLCALNPELRTAYADSVYRALKPRGNYLAIFFRVVSDYTGAGPPHPIGAAEIEALFDARFERVESFVPQQFYPSRPLGSEQVVWMRRRD